MVGPLVEHMAGSLILQVGHRILSDEDEAEGGNEVIDAVVDLRIDVVRTSRKDDAVFSGVF